EIPEGWDVHSAGEFIRVIRGVSYNPEDISEEAKEGYVPLVKSNNLQNGHVDFCNPIYVPRNIVDETQYLNNNSIFVTMSSGSINHVGKTAIIPFDSGYCYGAFCSKIELNPKYRCLLSMYFTSDFFKRIIHTIVVGTSIKNINNIHLTNNYLALPNNDVLIHDFESRINPILDKLGVIILENKQLTELRDFLLPMLMNGQIKIDP
ncbi:MAG: restriction endonuclease subunit S, partial [Methanomicrobium sp.]|nr:restriction endonuclease subunit S [Methanomicrobium sp.]